MTVYDNKIFPATGLSDAKTTDAALLAEGLRIALDAGHGTMTAHANRDLVLDISVEETVPKWVELAWSGGQKDLSQCREVALRLVASAEHVSWVQPVLRLHSAEGFRDVFSQERLVLNQSAAVQDVLYFLTPRDLDGCHAIDVHLFFEPRANSIYMHSLCVTAFR